MKIIRNYLNNVKPNFVGEGKYTTWFPLFDAIENLVFSTDSTSAGVAALVNASAAYDLL